MIREVKIQDLPKMQALAKQLFEMHYLVRPDAYYSRHCMNKKYLQSIIDNPLQHCFVYEKEKEILGYILITELKYAKNSAHKKHKIGEISNIIIDQSKRNQHIGKELFCLIQKLAIENKVFAIEVSAFAFNNTATKFYENMGMSAKTICFEKLLNKQYQQKISQITIKSSDKTTENLTENQKL